MDQSVISGKLANGLSYYFKPYRPEERRVHLSLVVRVGSLHEEQDQRGVARFVERMLFRGTERFPKARLQSLFEQVGLTPGAHANATTQYDRTLFQLTVPAQSSDALAQALDLLSDWASAATFEPGEIEDERRSLIGEWQAARAAPRRVGERQREALLSGSRYAERDVLGDQEVLARADRDSLLRFYRAWYRPERMAVVAVGAVDAGLREEIERRLGGLQASAPAAPEPKAEIQVRRALGATVVADEEAPASQVAVLLKGAAHPLRTDADYRGQVLQALGALLLSHRLEETTLDAGAPCVAASSGFSPSLFGTLELVDVSGRARRGRVAECLDAMLTELERLRRHGFVSTEVDRAAAEYQSFLEQAVEAKDALDLSAVAASLTNHFVSGSVVPAADTQLSLGTRVLQQVSEADVNEAVSPWFTEREQLGFVVAAKGEPAPSVADVERSMTVSRTRLVPPYEDRLAGVQLMTREPTPGAIVKEERLSEIDTVVWTLSNGARVVLRPTPVQRGEVLLQAVSPGGTAALNAEGFVKARAAHELVVASGLGSLDRPTLGRLLMGKSVQVYPWIDDKSAGFRASASARDLETLLQLVHLYANEPRRDPSVFLNYQERLRAEAAERSHSPSLRFQDALTRALWGTTPRRNAPTAREVDSMDLDSALEFYRQRFSVVSDFTFVLVGDLDPERLRPQVERYLGSLPGGAVKVPARSDSGVHRKPGVSRVRLAAAPDDTASVVLIYHGEKPWSEALHTDLAAIEGYLSSRLEQVLRGPDGRPLTIQVSSSFDRVPFGAYSLAIAFDCPSKSAEALANAARAEIQQLKRVGVPDANLVRLRAQRRRSLEQLYRSNEFWLERLVAAFEQGSDPREIARLGELEARLTSDNLQRSARELLRDDQYLDARLMPAAHP